VDDHGVAALDRDDADLQQRAGGLRADEHRELLVAGPLGDRVANGVQQVLVGLRAAG
jgi:hypothetical protein